MRQTEHKTAHSAREHRLRGGTGTVARPRKRTGTTNRHPSRHTPTRRNSGLVRMFMLLMIAATMFFVVRDLNEPRREQPEQETPDIGEYIVFDPAGDVLSVSSALLHADAEPGELQESMSDWLYAFGYEPDPAVAGRGMELDGDYLTAVSFDESSKSMIVHSRIPVVFNIKENGESTVITAINPRTRYDAIVLIDAGHGGHDTGAPVGNVLEKDINLVISQKLLALFESGGSGVKAYLTRNEDYYPELRDRAELGNEIADLFVSIHNNTYSADSSVHGAETQYNPNPAAAAEGGEGAATSRLSVDNRTLAEMVQSGLVAATGAKDRGVVQRDNLVVLNVPEIPAVLVESGFLTNAAEREKLLTDEYCGQVALGIYNGILAAFGIER